tara:strand:+ start:18597 stop:19742 length:1146 start_codon:yes stop_codon:yes gene_type:complete
MTTDFVVPANFVKVLTDFTLDLHTTFPEYSSIINTWWRTEDDFKYIDEMEERRIAFEHGLERCAKMVFSFCSEKMTCRFMDILNKNEDIFKIDSEVDTEFLPNIHFKHLWHLDISDQTRATIWKYLQLLVFSIVATNKEIFDSFDKETFEETFHDTLLKMKDLFVPIDATSAGSSSDPSSSASSSSVPSSSNPDMSSFMANALNSKFGMLAKEELASFVEDLNADPDNTGDMQQMLKNLLKDPSKILKIMNSLGDKIENKVKSGELSELDMMGDITDMMSNLKGMPGMENMLGGLGGLAGMGDMQSMVETLIGKKSIPKPVTKPTKLQKNKSSNVDAEMKEVMDKITYKPELSEQELIDLFASVNLKPNDNTQNKKKKKKK